MLIDYSFTIVVHKYINLPFHSWKGRLLLYIALTIDPTVCTGSVVRSLKKFKLFITTHAPLTAHPRTCYTFLNLSTTGSIVKVMSLPLSLILTTYPVLVFLLPVFDNCTSWHQAMAPLQETLALQLAMHAMYRRVKSRACLLVRVLRTTFPCALKDQLPARGVL